MFNVSIEPVREFFFGFLFPLYYARYQNQWCVHVSKHILFEEGLVSLSVKES